MSSMTNFSKNMFWPFDPTPGIEGVCNDRICFSMVLYTTFLLIWYENMTTFRKKNVFDLWSHPRGRGCVKGQNTWVHVAACAIPFNLICNMNIFWKKMNFDLFTPPLGSGVYWQTICYHVGACVIPFNLIFWKSWPLPHPLNPPRGGDGWWLDTALRTIILLYIFHIYCTSVCMRNFSKNIDNWMSYCEFDLWPYDPWRGQWAWIKF